MRLLVVLILGGIIGWIVGSLYPAPQAWLAWINRPAIEEHLNPGAQDPATTRSTPAPTPESSAQPAPSSTPPSAQSSHRGPVDAQTLNQYRAWIHEARQTHPYPDSEDRMYALMMCESRGQATLVNPAGPYSGLFQYSSATWRGAWNTYRDQSILDPRAQIFATALAFQRHMQGQWGC
ncbi:MAG: hypothetical protein HY054_04185 [Proteobacteria bacterium]|nr:hypothetical protein [Pseudomonadota bacterium]